MEMKIMAAMCDGNRGIGKDRRLPWPRLQEDNEYYRGLVRKRQNPEKKNLVIQGRKTWEGGSPRRKSELNSIHVVVSKTYDASKDPFQPIVVPSIDDAVKLAMTPEMQREVESVWVLGGQRVWEDTIAHPLCKRIYLTRIYQDFDSDVFFPPFEDKFIKSSDPDVDGKMREDKGIQFQFLVYDRK